MDPLDNTLWIEFLAGSEQAFERIFRTYYRDLYDYGMRLTSEPDLVDDCLQNLFQRLWFHRIKLRPVEAAAIKPYLFKGLRNQLINEWKAQRRRSTLHADYSAEVAFEVQYSPEDFLISQQLSAAQNARLLTALGQLSNRQREAIYLKFFDGFSYDRISEIMELNQQSARNLIH